MSLLMLIAHNLCERNAEVSLCILGDDKELSLSLPGWYKHGKVFLTVKKGQLVLTGRYGVIDTTDDFEPALTFDWLTRHNYEQWKAYRDRYEGWSSPDVPYQTRMIELGLVKPEKVVMLYQPAV